VEKRPICVKFTWRFLACSSPSFVVVVLGWTSVYVSGASVFLVRGLLPTEGENDALHLKEISMPDLVLLVQVMRVTGRID
jgi:hypothetical protein